MPVIDTEYINNTKMAHTLRIRRVRASPREVRLNIKSIPRKNVSISATLRLKDKVSLDTEITPYDMAIMDAVCTLYVVGGDYFTAEMIARVLAGNFGNKTLSPECLRDIKNSMDKLAVIRVKLDVTDEYKIRHKVSKDNNKRITFESYLLPIEKTTVVAGNGKELNGYHLIEAPVLYRYAHDVGQVLCIPLQMLSIGNVARNTQCNILIKRYLAERISLMLNENNMIQSRMIRYEGYDSNGTRTGLYQNIGVYREDFGSPEAWRNKRADIHHTVCSVLNCYIEKGIITEYTIIKEQRQIVGVKVTLPIDVKQLPRE